MVQRLVQHPVVVQLGSGMPSPAITGCDRVPPVLGTAYMLAWTAVQAHAQEHCLRACASMTWLCEVHIYVEPSCCIADAIAPSSIDDGHMPWVML